MMLELLPIVGANIITLIAGVKIIQFARRTLHSELNSSIAELERECEIRDESGELVHNPQPKGLAPGEHTISVSEYRRAQAEKIARAQL